MAESDDSKGVSGVSGVLVPGSRADGVDSGTIKSVILWAMCEMIVLGIDTRDAALLCNFAPSGDEEEEDEEDDDEDEEGTGTG